MRTYRLIDSMHLWDIMLVCARASMFSVHPCVDVLRRERNWHYFYSLNFFISIKLFVNTHDIVPVEVDKMRAILPNLNDCAVPFLSRAAANLCWYSNIFYTIYLAVLSLFARNFLSSVNQSQIRLTLIFVVDSKAIFIYDYILYYKL